MLSSAVIVFAIAAVGGLILAVHVLRNRFAPWLLSIVHALLGATGLVLVLLAVIGGGGGSLILGALLTLVVAALGPLTSRMWLGAASPLSCFGSVSHSRFPHC